MSQWPLSTAAQRRIDLPSRRRQSTQAEQRAAYELCDNRFIGGRLAAQSVLNQAKSLKIIRLPEALFASWPPDIAVIFTRIYAVGNTD